MLPMASAGQGASWEPRQPCALWHGSRGALGRESWIMISAIAVTWGGLRGAVPHPEPLSGGVSAREGDVSL